MSENLDARKAALREMLIAQQENVERKRKEEDERHAKIIATQQEVESFWNRQGKAALLAAVSEVGRAIEPSGFALSVDQMGGSGFAHLEISLEHPDGDNILTLYLDTEDTGVIEAHTVSTLYASLRKTYWLLDMNQDRFEEMLLSFVEASLCSNQPS
ncbi:hypothetical protein FHS85_004932 [Rhodoligotrophos appendicifer]|uniref:hypothetical protein n=1 Tax=Rhodoligotrophos appendicifer TaxID=987056 RepID=UPI001184BADA|nr:hypothetical protein [Rhodoligotrophos appendicifer]